MHLFEQTTKNDLLKPDIFAMPYIFLVSVPDSNVEAAVIYPEKQQVTKICEKMAP